jgi:hypothetical protein
MVTSSENGFTASSWVLLELGPLSLSAAVGSSQTDCLIRVVLTMSLMDGCAIPTQLHVCNLLLWVFMTYFRRLTWF